MNSFDYKTAFGINSGLLSPAEQDKLRHARVLITGMSAGGVMAVMLARAGVEHFTLVDHHKYELSDLNRDIGCYPDTVGKYKVEVIKQEIRRINPTALVQVVTTEISLAQLPRYLSACDVFFAQADDLAFSVQSVIMAQRHGKLTITYMPGGALRQPETSHLPTALLLFTQPSQPLRPPLAHHRRQVAHRLVPELACRASG
jgi:tRNA A37 threonylcarbamoyladenosine dehydratase